MSLGGTNINVSGVNAELGVSGINQFSNLVGYAPANKWAFWAPGILSVDANKSAVYTPPVSGFKIGDYRGYDNGAYTPSANGNMNLNWSPGDTALVFTVVGFPYKMNYKLMESSADYITVKFYTSEADRAVELNSIAGTAVTQALVYSIISLYPGHSRTGDRELHTPQIIYNVSIPTSELTPSPKTLYADMYLSDVAQNRRVNLGNNKSNGYFSILCTLNEYPTIAGGNFLYSTTITGGATKYRTDDLGGCLSTQTVNLIPGSAVTIYGYVYAFKYGGGAFNQGARLQLPSTNPGLDCRLLLKKNNVTQYVITPGNVGTNLYIYFSQDGVNVNWGDDWTVDISVLAGKTVSEIDCPI